MFHLLKRALTSFRNHPVSSVHSAMAEKDLLPDEFLLWRQMQHRDQRHSLEVLSRFNALMPTASREERAAALLHDVGKSVSTLGWMGRVCATLVGGRTKAFREYLRHEEIGLDLLRGVSAPRTIEVLAGRLEDGCVIALRNADNI